MDLFSQRRASTASSVSTTSSPVRTKALSEQHRQLTETLIRLKFEIAEQKGKHGELQFDWQKLNSEKHSIHSEIVEAEKECASIRDETDQIRVERTRRRQRLDQLVADNLPERRAADEVQAEHDKTQSELQATKEEIQNVKAAGEKLHKAIEDLKEHAAEISSERVKISAQSDEVKSEIETLKQEIVAMRSSVQNTKEKSDQYELDLIAARKENVLLAKQNDVLESKIAAREEYLEKHK
mmetsp:Transcript_16835/g.25380  ORF Transcript_16835/g.25380 Transcript_16835/m.25380 type:complete len:239 (+) Transcript_16835:161-877(+)